MVSSQSKSSPRGALLWQDRSTILDGFRDPNHGFCSNKFKDVHVFYGFSVDSRQLGVFDLKSCFSSLKPPRNGGVGVKQTFS